MLDFVRVDSIGAVWTVGSTQQVERQRRGIVFWWHVGMRRNPEAAEYLISALADKIDWMIFGRKKAKSWVSLLSRGGRSLVKLGEFASKTRVY